eukprot:CAMPEP_0172466042 /NCGR_PEP_ID=MMETSP1065-20121228/55097_1 /TAXON_ID=265537 /ORGANISM="Amphiprora paludosa, Strain CCMP125" /LENGTH=50 /DNA_ID=CAMNT_0013222739 /DNA_START=886 /DNA_END=1038 /DNA_ORIENTATION=-
MSRVFELVAKMFDELEDFPENSCEPIRHLISKEPWGVPYYLDSQIFERLS